ncbi:hypothetical protein R3W88_018913 [Solanum pinnatisectum]|uniref:S-locus F-box protein type-1 n=1 Tax=Solanum pinnatisectum TaxID=50273 RepID=A0AAV9KHS8_9SOLN|nr:hypothetical protein R3W88_018913 [Solanum pinnatisectum]
MITFEEYSELTSSFRYINQQLTLEELNTPFMIRDINESYRGTISVLGSCHGLILINIDKHVYLWNPATHFYTKVIEFEFDTLNLDHYYTRGGLCFDYSKNIYKVVYDEL